MNSKAKIFVMSSASLAAGFLSSIWTRDGVGTWYQTIRKPPFNPPDWIFGPVWTALYITMGVSAGLVWSRIDQQRSDVKKGLTFFGLQLALNALWSYLFFSLHSPKLALLDIVLLLAMIYKTHVQFNQVSKTAGLLLVPYLLWVGFATVLNGSICWLNL